MKKEAGGVLYRNDYLCSMEENNIYLRDDLVSVDVGDGYKDYLLSDILGDRFSVSFFDVEPYQAEYGYCYTLWFGINCPDGVERSLTVFPAGDCAGVDITRESLLHFSDVVVRAYDDESSNFYWVTLLDVSGKPIADISKEFPFRKRLFNGPMVSSNWYLCEKRWTNIPGGILLNR